MFQQCSICLRRSFRWLVDLHRHYATRHFYDELLEKLHLEGGPPFKCKTCGHSCPNKEQAVSHFAVVHRGVVQILEDREREEAMQTEGKSALQMSKNPNPASKKRMSDLVMRQWIVKECVEEMVSVTNVAKKWHWTEQLDGWEMEEKIREWVERADLLLPEQNKIAIYPESPFRPSKCKLIFCHLELLRSSSSPTTHLTQLAATNTTNLCNVFLPIIPSILIDLLDGFRAGNLLEAMKMIRTDQNTFIFREQALVSETERLECVQEKKALDLFFKYLELAGPNVVLVGVDENTIGVLLQKLESHNASKFLQLVVGYTWWRRIHGGGAYMEYDSESESYYDSESYYEEKSAYSGYDWKRDDFHAFKQSNSLSSSTCSMVVAQLRDAVRFVARSLGKIRQGTYSQAQPKCGQILRDFADRIGINMMIEPKVVEEQIEAGREDEEVVQLTNSFLPVPSTSFVLQKLDNVDISSDSESDTGVTEVKIDVECDQVQSQVSGEYFEKNELKIEENEYFEKDEHMVEEKEYFEKDEPQVEEKEYFEKDELRVEGKEFKTKELLGDGEYMEIENKVKRKDIQIESGIDLAIYNNDRENRVERSNAKIKSPIEASGSAVAEDTLSGEYVEEDEAKSEEKRFQAETLPGKYVETDQTKSMDIQIVETSPEFSGEYIEMDNEVERKNIQSVSIIDGTTAGEYVVEEEDQVDRKYIRIESRTRQGLGEDSNEPPWYCPAEDEEEGGQDEEDEEEEEGEGEERAREEEVVVLPTKKKRPQTISEVEKNNSLREFQMMAKFRKRSNKKQK